MPGAEASNGKVGHLPPPSKEKKNCHVLDLSMFFSEFFYKIILVIKNYCKIVPHPKLVTPSELCPGSTLMDGLVQLWNKKLKNFTFKHSCQISEYLLPKLNYKIII